MSLEARIDDAGDVWCGSPGCRARHRFGSFMRLVWPEGSPRLTTELREGDQAGPTAYPLDGHPALARVGAVQYVQRGDWRVDADGYAQRRRGQTREYQGVDVMMGKRNGSVPRLPYRVECPDCRRKMTVPVGPQDTSEAYWEGYVRLT